MDERLIALGLARPADSPVAAPAATPLPVPVAAPTAPAAAFDRSTAVDERLIALGLAPAPDAPGLVQPVAPPPPPVPAAIAAPAAVPPPPAMDERLIALGLAEAPVAAPPVAAQPIAPPIVRSVAPSVARPVAPPIVRSVAPPVARPAAPPMARPAPPVARAPAQLSAPVSAPAPVTRPVPAPVARPTLAVRQAIRLRDGWRDRDAICEVDGSGMRISGGTGGERLVPWPDLRSIAVEDGRVDIATPSGSISMAVALDGVSEPDLGPLFARVLEDGRAGALDPTGAVHELTLGVDRAVDRFADADDPIVPIVVGAFAVVAAIMLGAAIPMIVVLGAHLQAPPPGTFAILPRVASFDPRVIVAAFASAIALAGAAGRLALGSSAEAWARGTLRGWHRSARSFEAAARRTGAWLMLRPRLAAVVAAVALVTLAPAVFARTTLDPQGINESFGLPLISHDRSWAQLAEVSTLQVSTSERQEGFEVQLVFSDGSTVSTRGRDLVGGNGRALYDFARAQAR